MKPQTWEKLSALIKRSDAFAALDSILQQQMLERFARLNEKQMSEMVLILEEQYAKLDKMADQLSSYDQQLSELMGQIRLAGLNINKVYWKNKESTDSKAEDSKADELLNNLADL